MPFTKSHRLLVLILLPLLAGGGLYWWYKLRPGGDDGAFARGNGRIEATEVDVAAKLAGRLTAVLVQEGDDVTAGQVLATMDAKVLKAELRAARAAVLEAGQKKASAEAVVEQRRNEILAAEALTAQRASQLRLSQAELDRTRTLHAGGNVAQERLDVDQTAARTGAAQLDAANAQLYAAKSALEAAKAGVLQAQAAVEAAEARAEGIQADIADSSLVSPIDGRALYRLAEPGEVLAAGGRVLTLLDVSDVYMTLFLPTSQAGRAALDAEARIVLDARPDLSIPARVTFVSPQAQFTPKAVETSEEREKLMFRVKVAIPPALLRKYAKLVKTGLPGVAYVRLDPKAPWPKEVPPLIQVEGPAE